MYVAGLVAYDGTDYCGYQYQVGVPTIQGELEAALRAFTTLDGRIIGSGRTDTGVHAAGQVISVEVPWQHSLADLQRAWNVHLSSAIQVWDLKEAHPKFHPRFSALSRTYRYAIDMFDELPGQGPDCESEAPSVGNGLAPQRAPLTQRYALFEPHTLDVERMRQAVQHLLGEHDFATFGRPPQGENSVRRVLTAEWLLVSTNLQPLATPSLQRVAFTIEANAFLRRMVRSIVGTLLEVGRGRRTPESVAQALAAQDRSRAAPPVAPQGLSLERVVYPPDLTPWPEHAP